MLLTNIYWIDKTPNIPVKIFNVNSLISLKRHTKKNQTLKKNPNKCCLPVTYVK